MVSAEPVTEVTLLGTLFVQSTWTERRWWATTVLRAAAFAVAKSRGWSSCWRRLGAARAAGATAAASADATSAEARGRACHFRHLEARRCFELFEEERPC